MRNLLAAAAVVLAAVSTPALGADTGTGVTLDPAGARQLLALVNATRAAHGAAPLTRDPGLEAVAVEHTLAMARSGVLQHNDALFTRAAHTALGIKVFAENVAYDWSVPASHQGFLDSAPHRANLLGADYRLAGFAVARDASGKLWVTEDFGTPRVTVAAPAPKPVAARPAAPKPAAAPRAPRTTAAAPAPKPAAAKPAAPKPAAAAPAPRAAAVVREAPESPDATPVDSVGVASRRNAPSPAGRSPLLLLGVVPLLVSAAYRRLAGKARRGSP